MMAKPQQYSLRWNNYFRQLTYALDTHRVNDEFVDVSLLCDGRKIKAHKVVLSACSSYFKEILTENPHPHPLIIFKFVKYEDLNSIIKFMYQGEVNVQQDTLQSFLQTAELLSVHGLNADDSDKSRQPTAVLSDHNIINTIPSTSTVRPVNIASLTTHIQKNISSTSNSHQMAMHHDVSVTGRIQQQHQVHAQIQDLNQINIPATILATNKVILPLPTCSKASKKRRVTFSEDGETSFYTKPNLDEQTIVESDGMTTFKEFARMDIPEYGTLTDANNQASGSLGPNVTQFKTEYELLDAEIEEKYQPADNSEIIIENRRLINQSSAFVQSPGEDTSSTSNFGLTGYKGLSADDNIQSNLMSPASSTGFETLGCAYNILSMDGAENFNTKQELQLFLEKHHRLIVENFKVNQKLSNAERVKISKSIIRHLLTNPHRILSTSELQNISELIVEVFVGEIPNTFYQKFTRGRHASGKLHDAYNNYRAALATSGLIYRRSKSKTPARNQLELDEAYKTVDEKDIIERALKHLTTDANLDSCVDAWRKSFAHRQQQLKGEISTAEYIKRYPVLEQPDGYKLYLMDAQNIIKTELELEISEEFISRIIGHMKKTKSGTVDKVLQLIAEESNETNRSIIALMLLPFLFPSSLKRGSGGVVKLSKAECADSFIRHFQDLNTAESEVRNIQENSTELQPLIIFIGSPVTTAWVLVAHTKYSFTDLTLCMKCAISSYIALNIKYPSNSEKAWFLLQKYFFKISTSFDELLESSVKTLANDFNLITK